MGKSLIIKGADFSQNAIDSVWMETTPLQGYIITNPQNAAYGKMDLRENVEPASIVLNAILAKILIPAGKSMSVVVENNGTRVTDLNMGYVASQNNVAMVNDAVVTSIATNHHPADSALRESDGGFTVENSTANDMYFYMNICYDLASGPNFLVSGKQVLYKVVD